MYILNYISISKYGIIIIVALHGLLLTQQDVQSCMQVYWITGDTLSKQKTYTVEVTVPGQERDMVQPM